MKQIAKTAALGLLSVLIYAIPTVARAQVPLPSQNIVGPIGACSQLDPWGSGDGCDLGNNGNWGIDNGGDNNIGIYQCQGNYRSDCENNIGVDQCNDNWWGYAECDSNIGINQCNGNRSNWDVYCGSGNFNIGIDQCNSGWSNWASECNGNIGIGQCNGLYSDGPSTQCDQIGVDGCTFPGIDQMNLLWSTIGFASGSPGTALCMAGVAIDDPFAITQSVGDIATPAFWALDEANWYKTVATDTADSASSTAISLATSTVGSACGSAAPVPCVEGLLPPASSQLSYLTGTAYPLIQSDLCQLAGVSGQPTDNPEFAPCQGDGYLEQDAADAVADTQSIPYDTLQNGLWGPSGGFTSLNEKISQLNNSISLIYNSNISGDCATQTPPGSAYCQLFGFAQWEWGQLLTGWGFPIPSNPGGLIPPYPVQSVPAAGSTQPVPAAAAGVLQ